MAESDEDYHSHRREKFYHERGNYGPFREKEPRHREHQKDRVWDRSREQDRKEHRHHRKDHDHREKGQRHHDRGHDMGHHERGHHYHKRRERFSPEHDSGFQLPTKHMRRDWDARCQGGSDFRAKQGGRRVSDPHLHPRVASECSSMQQGHGNFIPARFGGSLSPPPPGHPPCGLQSFKDFLLGLGPAVSEMEAVRCYTEYKLAFRRQQMEAFFLAHREEEWFRLRYHPEDLERCDTKTRDALQKRLGVYMYLSGMGWFENVSLDLAQAPAILKVLDAVQILFEGGTENDLQVLEEEEEKRKERPLSRHQTLDEGQAVHSKGVKVKSTADSEQAPLEPIEPKGAVPDASDLIRLARKKKHIDEGEVSECDTASILHPSGLSAEGEAGEKRQKESMSDREMKEKKSQEDEEEIRASKPLRPFEEERKAKDGENEEVEEEQVQKDEKKIREERELGRDEPPPLPRYLHKTRSLFMRNIPPSICKEEIVNLCVKYAGFRRVCLSEPLAEYRFFRRCWVTFDHLADIQDICWQLQNARVREYKLSPVVHRDPCRRVRTTNGITQHWMLLQDHIRLADKLIRSLDSRWTLWGKDQEKGNPLLKNISYHLIEEVNAEEEELSGHVGGATCQCEVTVERDENLIKVLDRLLVYLRIVHSVDFYNACHHASENDMPCCCGFIHVRGPVPPNRVLTQQMWEWQKKFEAKLSLLSPREALGEEEAERMGCRHPAQEVEKFIRANTHEIDRDKWLCVLCAKKFKGPEFAQKHLLTRHREQVEEVRKEAVFFNNFLMDPKRPALPEMRSPPPMPPRPGQGGGGGGGPELLFSPQCVWGFGQPSPSPSPGPGPSPSPSPSPSPPFIGYQGSAVPPNTFGGDGGHWSWFGGALQGKPQLNRVMHRGPRKVIRYTDLDAPGEDFF